MLETAVVRNTIKHAQQQRLDVGGKHLAAPGARRRPGAVISGHISTV